MPTTDEASKLKAAETKARNKRIGALKEIEKQRPLSDEEKEELGTLLLGGEAKKTNTQQGNDANIAGSQEDDPIKALQEEIERLKAKNAELLKNAEHNGVPDGWDPKKIGPMDPDWVILGIDKQRPEPLYVSIGSGDFHYEVKIPRGVRFQLPHFAAEHVREMQRQDANTVMLISGLVEQYQAALAAANAVK